MTKAEFFDKLDQAVGPIASAQGWVACGDGLFIRDEGDFLFDFQISGAFRSLEADSPRVPLTALVSITSRILNNSNLIFSEQKPVKSAKKQVLLAMGCRLSQLSVKVVTESHSWNDAAADLVQRCNAEAENIKKKYGSIEKIAEYYEALYRNADEKVDRQVLLCIRMWQQDYEGALQLISEARPNLILDKDYTIWGYAARFSKNILANRR